MVLLTSVLVLYHHKFVLKLIVHRNLGDHDTNCTFPSLSVMSNTLFTLAASTVSNAGVNILTLDYLW